jgi:DNA-binding MarR family transcriptional regulator
MTNLTNLELDVLTYIDQSEYGDTLRDDVWFWAADMAADLNITAKAVGGVVTSLQEKGLVRVNIVTAAERRLGDESTIGMTEAGEAAYVAAYPDHKKPTRAQSEARWAARNAAPVTTAQEDFVAAILG